MNSPYFNTYLCSTVALHPSQMNNDITKHLKNNLIKNLQGKCYKNFGYVSKIYSIVEKKGGNIIAEDPSASALYDVKFTCKLCRPLINTFIICEVRGINKQLIHLANGPIQVLIFDSKDKINQDNFTYDDNKNMLLANIGNGKGIQITVGSYVKVKVISARCDNGASKIIVIGSLEKLADKSETDNDIATRENDDIEFVDYTEHVSSNEIIVDEVNDIETDDNDDNDDDEENK